MVSWFPGWRIDRCNENTPDRKIKMGTQFFFFWPPDSNSGGLLVPQKWFTYQNVQNFARKKARPFLEQFIQELTLQSFRNKNYLTRDRKIVVKGLNNKQIIFKSVLFFFPFFSTVRLQFSGVRKKLGQAEFFFIFTWPTDWSKLAREKSAIQGINWPWPKCFYVLIL